MQTHTKRTFILILLIFFFYGCVVGREILLDTHFHMTKKEGKVENIPDNIQIQCKSFKKSFFSDKLNETIQPLSACQYIDKHIIAGILLQSINIKNPVNNEPSLEISVKIYFDLGNFFVFFGKAMAIFLIPLETNVRIDINFKVQDKNGKVLSSKSFKESYTEVTHWHFINSKYSANQMIPKIIYKKINDIQRGEM